MATRSGIVAGRAFVIIEALDRTPAVLRRVQANFFRLGAQLQQMGASMVTRALMALTPAALSTRVFSNFDDSMRKVEARSSGTADELAAVRQQAMLLGRTTAFTARQIAELQAILAQRGFTRTQIFDMSPGVMALARGAGTGNREQDILVSADLVSGAIRAFKLEAKEAGTVADLMTSAVNNSNFSLDDLVISMANAGAIAKIFNNDLSRTLATLAAMRDVNLDPSIAGTGLRNIFLKASDAKGREEFNEQLQELTGSTIDFVNAAGDLADPADLLFSIFDAAQKLGTAQRGRLFADLFGLRAIVPAAALAQSKQRFQTLMDGFQQAGGTAMQTMELMEAGIGGSFRRLVSALEGMGIALGETLSGSIQTANGHITNLLLAGSKWIEQNGMLIQRITATIAVIIPLGSAVFLLGTAFKLLGTALTPIIFLLTSVQTLLALAGTIIGSIIGMIISIATTVIGVVIALVAKIAGLIVIGALVGANIIPLILLLGVVLGLVAASVIALTQYFVSLWSSIKTGAIGFWGVLQSIGQSLKGLYQLVMTVFGGIIDAVAAGELELAWNLAVQGMTLVWLGFKDMILDTLATLSIKFRQLLLNAQLILNTAHQAIRPFSDNGKLINRATDIEKELNKIRFYGSTNQQRRDNYERHQEIESSKNVIEDLLREIASKEGGALADRIRQIAHDNIFSPQTIPGIDPTVKNLIKQGPALDKGLKPSDVLNGLQKNSLDAAKQFYKNQKDALIRDTKDDKKVELLGNIDRNTQSLTRFGGV